MMSLPTAILTISDDADREFMETLYLQHRVSMFRMARSLTASEHDAADVVSDACVSLIRKIALLRRLDCNVLEGYIISTVKNTAYTLRRRKKTCGEVSGEEIFPFIEDENAAPDRRILQECTIQELMNAIQQLSEDDQMVLRMKYFEKCSEQEIAKAFGIQAGSVRSKLLRARRRVLVLLGGAVDES